MSLKKYFLESAEIKQKFIAENEEKLQKVIYIILQALKNWKKLLIAWNGWSAADAQHWAAELIGRYKLNRKALPAIALTTDTSILTAVWNDFWFEQIFEKQVEWLWEEGDIFIGISTSWNSENIIRAIKKAKEKWLITICLTGKWWGKMNDLVDINLIVPSDNTPRIQECHMTIYHTICEEIEKTLFV